MVPDYFKVSIADDLQTGIHNALGFVCDGRNNNIELGIHVYLAHHDLGLFLILPSSVCKCVHVVNLTKITSVNVNYFMC